MDKLLLQGIDRDLATVDLTGEVDVDMYRKVLISISILKDADYITFVLNTVGGSFYQGLAIHDLIKYAVPNSKIVCVGEVMSAGITILMAGAERVAYPNTQFLVHFGEETNNSPQEASHNSKMTTVVKRLIGERVNVTKRTINTWFKKETYFDAKQALDAGLIDRMVTDD